MSSSPPAPTPPESPTDRARRLLEQDPRATKVTQRPVTQVTFVGEAKPEQ